MIKTRYYALIAATSIILGCSDSPNHSDVTATPIDLVSSDNEVQQAYERCVTDTRTELKADNPDAPAEVMKFMLDGANQTCHSAVITTCEKSKTSDSCKMMLQIYGG